MADEKQLFDLATETIDEYAERDQDYDNLEQYYFLDGDQDPNQDSEDETVDIVRLPYITNVVDLVQDLFASAEWSISVPAAGEKVTDQQLADDAEEYLKAVFHQSERAQRQDFLSRAAWLVAMRGCLAGRVMRVNDWLERSEKGKLAVGDKIPLLIQMRDPRYVYPEFGLDGLSYVVERFTRTVGDVRRTYGEDVLPKKKRDEEIEWTEYWDSAHFYHWAAGELVQSGEHLCGGIPYAYEFARQTGKIEPEKRGRSFLQGMTAVVDRMNTLASMESTFVSNYIGSAWAFYGDSDAKIDLRPGAINRLDATDRLEPIQASRKALDLDASWAKLETHWERGTFPGTVFGADPGRVMSGYSLTILNQSGRMRLQPMISCVERLLETLLENVLMASEQWVSSLAGGKIPFYGYVRSGDKQEQNRKTRKDRVFDARGLGGVYQVEVHLGDLLPADEQTNLGMAQAARTPNANGLPLLSDETIREKYLNVGRDVDERTRIDRERIEVSNQELAAIKEALAVARRKEELAREVKKQLGTTVEELLVSRVPIGSADSDIMSQLAGFVGQGGGMPAPEPEPMGMMQGGSPPMVDEMAVEELPPEMIEGVM